MRVRVLGCSAGIGGNRHTTAFLLDDDILIDAGSGVTRLALDEIAAIRHVFISHAHFDHISSLPLLVSGLGDRSLTVHGLPEVLATLRQHIFNWAIWPDFSITPSREHPYLQYAPLSLNEPVQLDGRRITAIPANHIQPAAGYRLEGGGGSLIFSGDTQSHSDLWRIADETANLRYLLVECSFPSASLSLATRSGHYCTKTLGFDLRKLKEGVEVWVCHQQPGAEREIMAELANSDLTHCRPKELRPDQVFDLA